MSPSKSRSERVTVRETQKKCLNKSTDQKQTGSLVQTVWTVYTVNTGTNRVHLWWILASEGMSTTKEWERGSHSHRDNESTMMMIKHYKSIQCVDVDVQGPQSLFGFTQWVIHSLSAWYEQGIYGMNDWLVLGKTCKYILALTNCNALDIMSSHHWCVHILVIIHGDGIHDVRFFSNLLHFLGFLVQEICSSNQCQHQ